MKKALLLTVVLLLSSSLVFAQGGSIGVFADPGATVCNASDMAPGLLPIYVVHVLTLGSTASQFKVDLPPTLTFLGEINNFPVSIGTFLAGVSISYQSCLVGNINLGSINTFTNGLSAPCTFISVVPDPTAIPPGSVWTVDCTPSGNLVAATGGQMIINPDPSCDCQTPANDSSWGQIKALYN